MIDLAAAEVYPKNKTAGPNRQEMEPDMTPEEITVAKATFKANRYALGLSVQDLGDIINIDPRTIRRWEDKDDGRAPNPTAAVALEWMMNPGRPASWPKHIQPATTE